MKYEEIHSEIKSDALVFFYHFALFAKFRTKEPTPLNLPYRVKNTEGYICIISDVC